MQVPDDIDELDGGPGNNNNNNGNGNGNGNGPRKDVNPDRRLKKKVDGARVRVRPHALRKRGSAR